ncbi:hypothetical protein [Paenibacillus flagellatus]|uniref:Uncharacterized protein n=1 Tax=Paenibacillus flagellatus TaxID=2211139 RepID=A0A2V5K9Q9_9BACL|nr:hypothetical protein [Paenibacillus flagellatus]PYI56241.1 hypothetical protein DLM86_04450 [Paenibacillus flagellatus]
MNKTLVKTYRHRVGKNQYVIIHIYQVATAEATQGNAVANNALSVQIVKHQKDFKRHKLHKSRKRRS